MCGICGNVSFTKENQTPLDVLTAMMALLHHRGPEETGLYRDRRAALGHTRLKIVDLSGGCQPVHNEDNRYWLVYNGEIFNFPELKQELLQKGHRFYTHTDTEIIVHLYEEKGPQCLEDLNGQFAIALWDREKEQLFLARDRVGIRPLFYSRTGGDIVFASEIKAILADPRIRAELDPRGLDQLFTCWATIPPRTNFKNIEELPPAHYALVTKDSFQVSRYWDMNFSCDGKKDDGPGERLLALLKDAVRIRLRADVPVAAYLSGGLDSSFLTALAKQCGVSDLKTFSVTFKDSSYDESPYQRQMSDFLGTDHREVFCDYSTIGKIMPEVIWYAEKPLIRTAPAPLLLLSGLVRDNGIKVVLTGEGADEILGGYDIFREMKIRRFWARFPDSKRRPLLLRKLYQYIENWPRSQAAFLEAFYRTDLGETGNPCYSHLPRWRMTSWTKTFFSAALQSAIGESTCRQEYGSALPGYFFSWDPLRQAQYIEIETLLSGNLLSSQGDRMMMANAVEGRVPFLDHRVIEAGFCLPPQQKLKVLKEKYLLKKIAGSFVPEQITQRVKQGYRAPDSASFFAGAHKEFYRELLDGKNIREAAYFDAGAVEKIVGKCLAADGILSSARDNIALVGIVSTMLLHRMFIREFSRHCREAVDAFPVRDIVFMEQ